MPKFDLQKEIEYREERLKGLYESLGRCDSEDEARYVELKIKEQITLLALAREHLVDA